MSGVSHDTPAAPPPTPSLRRRQPERPADHGALEKTEHEAKHG